MAVTPEGAPGADRVCTARERLLAAADELFYAEGVQTVGIDRVIERAGVAKASLYNNFGSKEALVRAYLESRHAATMLGLRRRVAQVGDPRAAILAIFDAQGELFGEPSFNGCAFTSASAEARVGGEVQQATDNYRTEIRTLFTNLTEALAIPDPALLARQLHLLYDGAGSTARMDRDPSIAHAAKAAAEALIDAAAVAAPLRRGEA